MTSAVQFSDGLGELDSQALADTVSYFNEAPPEVSFTGTTSLAENTSTATHIKVANIVVTDDALGQRDAEPERADAASFEIDGSELFLKAGVALNFETKNSYAVTVNANDPTVGSNPDASQDFVLSVTDVNEAPTGGVVHRHHHLARREHLDRDAHQGRRHRRHRRSGWAAETLSLGGADADFLRDRRQRALPQVRGGARLRDQELLCRHRRRQRPTVGGNPDASQGFVLSITDVNEAPTGGVIYRHHHLARRKHRHCHAHQGRQHRRHR